VNAPILVIGGRPETLGFAKELGVQAVNIQHPSLVDRGDYGPGISTIYLDYTDHATLLRIVRGLHTEYGFKTAFSLTEPGSVPAAKLRGALGLSGHGAEVAHALHDKVAMRAVIADTPGLVNVAYAGIETVADLERFASEHGYPFILKPADGTASIGVRAVHDAAEARAALDDLTRLREDPDRKFREFFPLAGFMAEEFVTGPEFSVECFSFAGEHVVLGVTEKITTEDFVEAGHVFPARQDEQVQLAVAAGALAMLDAIGITDGPSHTELKLTERGPAVIESHDRIGGDRILDLVRLATGFDFERATVAWAAGLIDSSTAKVSPSNSAATRFAFGRSGLVESVTAADDILAMPYVRACHIDISAGRRVSAGYGNWDRIGQVICVAPDSRTAADAAAAAASAIDITLAEESS
jgi:biotin carboxylase